VPGPHHALLIPGFFGFANLNDFAYFGHVQDFLAEVGPPLGLTGEIRVVDMAPTASLRKRAASLAEAVNRLLDEGPEGTRVSLIGHSSGGLDARLLVSPDVSLPTSADVGRAAGAIRSIVCVSTPHLGTPLAHLFNTLFGQQLLRLLSLATIYSLRAGRLPLAAVLRLARLFRRKDEAPNGMIEKLARDLLADFSRPRRLVIEEFLSSLGKDQDLLGQITPGGMDVFNAATGDRPGVRYGCVVTRARAPGLRSALSAGLDPYAQSTHALFVALYRLASSTPQARTPRLDRPQVIALRRGYGHRPDVRANDGMVPTLSQVRGTLVHAAWADHHDIIGHFHQPHHVPPHLDWLTSGSGFDRAHFEMAWRAVAAWIVGE
jgi:triacylglycerol esterase/lipase EstA (alpha/beta hydrolase family)